MATSQHYSASTSSVSSSMSSTLDDREVSGGIGIEHDEDQEEGQQLLEVHSNMHPPTPSGIQTRAAAWSPPAPVLGDQKLNKAMPPIPKQDLENEVDRPGSPGSLNTKPGRPGPPPKPHRFRMRWDVLFLLLLAWSGGHGVE